MKTWVTLTCPECGKSGLGMKSIRNIFPRKGHDKCKKDRQQRQVMEAYHRNGGYPEKLSDMPKADDLKNSEVKVRICLACDRSFLSPSKAHRRCGKCKQAQLNPLYNYIMK